MVIPNTKESKGNNNEESLMALPLESRDKTNEESRGRIDRGAFEYVFAFLRFTFIAAYFLVWNRKTRFRDRLRLSSWAIVSVSTLLLLAKLVMESTGAHEYLSISSANAPLPHVPVFIVMPFLAFLLYHDLKESRKPAHEYEFVRQVTRFLRGRPATQTPAPQDATPEVIIRSALSSFPALFEKKRNGNRKPFQPKGIFKIFHKFKGMPKPRGFDQCSFYILDHQALGTEPYYFAREPDHDSYYYQLRKGEGVGGMVAKDGVVRYVPRLFFPFRRHKKFSSFLFFPHAVKFEVLTNADGSVELGPWELDCFAFKPIHKGNPVFRSLVSVPVKSTSETYGVMNFDFKRYDPLDKADIEMCSALGLLLGDEIGRVYAKP